MAVFRIEKTRDYTVMSNHHLKDRTLTLKSKGLLSMMLSLPDEWNYTTRGLAAICREGVDSIGAALKELETHGYIRRTQLRDEKGKITDTEYVIYEMPQCEPPSSPGTPLPGTAKPYTENPDMGIPDTAEPCTENPAQLNTNQTKTDLSSTELSNPIQSNPPTPTGARMGTDRMGARECYREVILDNIEYSYLVQDSHIDREQLDEIVDLIVDTVCSARKVIRIAGDDYPAEVVKSRFMKLNSSHVQYVMDCMKDNTTYVRNIKKYLLAADIAPYMDKDFFQNIPMTQTERITMASRPKQPKYARNKNILVIGGSGSGKTRFFCKPSLLQAHSSYVCTDPKGTLLPEIGAFLERKKYRIKCLNLINFRKSMKYNPLAYIRSEKDILKLVNALIMNTKGEGEKSSEDFWVKAERLYYSALIGYIWYEATEEEKNFITLLDLINASEAREDDETYQSPVDLLFSQLEEREPDHFAVKQYRKFKMAAGKTLKSILISCGARLAPFDIKELRDLMEYDELELDTLGDQKTALFVILSDTDSTFNFVAALMYSQLFNLLCDKADDFYGGRLPVHVRLILDEFANIGQIPNFDKLIATIRSREISASIILQSQSQLKTIYKDAADTIVGNCDSTLFLGGKEKSTLKEISELLGKETIDLYNQSENRGSQVSHGLSYQKLGKELMTQDELAVMDGGKCIFMLRGVRPFLSDKYDLTRHPNYRYTADADPKNVFDMERYMKKQRAVVKPTDTFDVYEIDATT